MHSVVGVATRAPRDYRLATLRRVVGTLGGELEVIANFGDRRIRLRVAGGLLADPRWSSC